MLPQRLETGLQDYQGRYTSYNDCAIARALKRHQISVGLAEGQISVGGFGAVETTLNGLYEPMGTYKLEDGSDFNATIFRLVEEGAMEPPVLILHED